MNSYIHVRHIFHLIGGYRDDDDVCRWNSSGSEVDSDLFKSGSSCLDVDSNCRSSK